MFLMIETSADLFAGLDAVRDPAVRAGAQLDRLRGGAEDQPRPLEDDDQRSSLRPGRLDRSGTSSNERRVTSER